MQNPAIPSPNSGRFEIMNDDYDVGFGKPPENGRFKKGQSGNPKGRPKGTKNLKTDLEEELQEQILIREGSTQR